MKSSHFQTAVCAALLALTPAAHAVDGEILITQAKALAGNVTPGDAPGFPVTLSLPGKYKLAGNLMVPEGAHGIDIDSDLVTLDLNGFTLQGPVTCTGFASNLACLPASNHYAIRAYNRVGLQLRNGAIRGFPYGISSLGNSGLAEDLFISEIGGTALGAGYGSIIRGNRLYKVGNGISSGGLVLNNTVYGSKLYGIYSSYGGLIIGNQAHYTGSTGIVGAYQGNAALVHNAASTSGGYGDGIVGGESLGGGTDNFCENNLC
ncbi:MAG: hypothetical protein AB1421_08450 [Pseudomonadota bacterium]